MSVPGAGLSSNLSQFKIVFAPVLNGPTIDDAASDPTLRTYVGVGVGIRRIQHFTGWDDVNRLLV